MLNRLKNRVLEISHKRKLGHLSSCLTALPIIYDILTKQNDDDIFILSNGHAGLAYYVVLEHLYGFDAEKLLDDMGIHPCMDLDRKIYCSTGSLGLGITVAVGYALGNPEKTVRCLISDGESFEGSVWESLLFKTTHQVTNLEIYVNANGFSAYAPVDLQYLRRRLEAFCPDVVFVDTSDFKIEGVLENSIKAHYYNLSDEDYEKATI